MFQHLQGVWYDPKKNHPTYYETGDNIFSSMQNKSIWAPAQADIKDRLSRHFWITFLTIFNEEEHQTNKKENLKGKVEAKQCQMELLKMQYLKQNSLTILKSRMEMTKEGFI